MTETKIQNYIRRLTNALESDTMQITHEVVLTEEAAKEIVCLLMQYEQLIITGQWIESKKALPTDREWYLGIFKEADTGWVNPLPYICDYIGKVTKATTKEGWIIRDCTDVDNPIGYYLNLECVAWMPLPEPFIKYG